VSNLCQIPRQLYLFKDFKKELIIDKVIDELNNRFGECTIEPANIMLAERVEPVPNDAPLKKNLAYIRAS
jgi:hypothetical protein